MAYLILNDLHAGLKRKTGVTQTSLKDFHSWQVNILIKAIEKHGYMTLIILGDLFDGHDVSYQSVFRIYNALMNHTGKIILVAGNHDLSKNTEKLSAFEFLCKLLPNAATVTTPHDLEAGCRIIPHVANQKLFDAHVDEAISNGITTLLCHCNYDNGFTVESDHSLNLTKEQAARFDHVIMGHEHNKRDLSGIDILGSPMPCTIAECSVAKGFHTWEGPSHELKFHEVWNPEAAVEIDWRETLSLESIPPDIDFVRVTGKATAEEAATVTDLVAKLRASISAYMITNSVKIGDLDLGDLEDSSETDLNTFDPMASLKGLLSSEHKAKLEAFQCA